MRIVVLSNRYPPQITGGYEISAALTTEALRRRGHESRVLTSTFGIGEPRIEGAVQRVLRRVVDSPEPLTLAFYQHESERAVQRAIAAFAPDVALAFNLESLFPTILRPFRRAGVPLVFHLHDLYLPGLLDFATRWREFWRARGGTLARTWAKAALCRLLPQLGVADGWPARLDDIPVESAVFCSDFARQYHADASIVPFRWRVIPTGTDLRRFDGRPRTPARPAKLLFVGRLHEEKGVHVALEAMDRLESRGGGRVTLSVVGVVPPDRTYFEGLRRFVAERGLDRCVHFLGQIPAERMGEIYARHDVLVLPSTREGLPRVALEAMAAGLCVVTTPAGGTRELVRNGENGLLFPVGDAQALAARLSELLAAPELPARLAAAGQREVRTRHDIDTVAAAIEEFALEVRRAAAVLPGRG